MKHSTYNIRIIPICILLLFIWNPLVSQAPIAGFTAGPRTICQGVVVSFTDTTQNNPTSWNWSFTGGSPNNSNSQNPGGIVYNSLGEYDVTLNVSNANGMDMLTKSDYINVIVCKPSQGVYRIPYSNGTDVRITNAHMQHNPVNNRIDMIGINSSNYQIVAAEDGWIRFIEDGNTDSQGDCDNNNYVWIEHPNGEWTKYSHMATNSTTMNAGLTEGDFVCAGTFLGFESDIGCATGPHLHWEVAVPDDPMDPIQVVGGFIKGENRIPVICDIATNVFVDNQEYTAAPCGSASCQDNIILVAGDYSASEYEVIIAGSTIRTPLQPNNATVFRNGSVGVFRAGDLITLGPGFRARPGSSFYATIKSCNSSPGSTMCNIILDR